MESRVKLGKEEQRMFPGSNRLFKNIKRIEILGFKNIEVGCF